MNPGRVGDRNGGAANERAFTKQAGVRELQSYRRVSPRLDGGAFLTALFSLEYLPPVRQEIRGSIKLVNRLT